MLKVLIADDEMLIRVGVKSTIEWEKYGFIVVAEACNGEDALEKIETFQPDILLTVVCSFFVLCFTEVRPFFPSMGETSMVITISMAGISQTVLIVLRTFRMRNRCLNVSLRLRPAILTTASGTGSVLIFCPPFPTYRQICICLSAYRILPTMSA